MKTKYIKSDYFQVSEPVELYDLFDANGRQYFGSYEIPKKELVAELSMISEGEIETINREIVSLMEFYIRTKSLIEDDLPNVEESFVDYKEFIDKIYNLIE